MQSKNFEEQSFENSVLFFAPELKRILRGHPVSEVLNNNRVKSFRRWGILIRNDAPGKRRHFTVVSDEARRILEKEAQAFSITKNV